MRRKPVVVVVLAVAVALLLGIVWRSHGKGSSSAGGGAGSASAAAAGKAKRKDGASGPATPALVAGHVTRKTDGAGIPNAVVSLARAELGAQFLPSDTPTIVITTDASGAWQAPRVMPGAYIVAATAPGFLPSARERMSVGLGDQRRGIDIALEAGGSIVSGTITDVGGGPIENARITFHKDTIQLSGVADFVAITGGDGKYTMSLPDGSFEATAAHDDYTSAKDDLLVAGKPVTEDFVLTPGAVIRGQVVARDSGAPVPGALVTAQGGHNHRGGGEHTAFADQTGNFTLRSLGSGSLTIKAAGRGYASANGTPVSVGIGEQVDGVKVVVDRAYSISGRVVKQGTKEGLSGVRLGAFSIAQQKGALAPDPSDDEGAFEIVGVQPGSYMLFAGGDESVPEIGKNVEVVDKDVTGVEIEMALGATIAGRVEPPVAGVSIGLSMTGPIGLGNMFEVAKSVVVHAETDTTGAFVLHHAPAGSFSITASATDGRAGSKAILIAAVDQSGVVVPLEPRGAVSGRVIDTNGKPAEGIKVSAHANREDEGGFSMSMMKGSPSATTAADGSFRIVGLDAGKFTIDAKDDDAFARFDKDKTKKPVEIEIANGAEKTGVVLTVEARDGELRGRVVGTDGKAVGDAWVTASREMTLPKEMADKMGDYAGWMSSAPPVLTGSDGAFTISKLRKGTYSLVAEGPRGASRGEKKGAKTGESTTIVLAQLGTLTGKVTLGGAPVPSYDLECHGPTGEVSQRFTAADGSYELDHLAPGSYRCEAESDAGTASAKLDIPAGPATQDLALTRWAQVTGKVVSVLTKQPVAGIYAIAGDEMGGGRGFGAVIAGSAPKTDASGQFVVDRVAVGKGKLTLMPKEGGFEHMTTRDYTASEGQRVDMGTIEIVPPREGDAGTFGFASGVEDDKVVVKSVKPGGPAEQAGMKVGDVVTSLNGIPVATLTPRTAQLVLSSGMIGVGITVQLALDRGGSPVTASLTSVKW